MGLSSGGCKKTITKMLKKNKFAFSFSSAYLWQFYGIFMACFMARFMEMTNLFFFSIFIIECLLPSPDETQ